MSTSLVALAGLEPANPLETTTPVAESDSNFNNVAFDDDEEQATPQNSNEQRRWINREVRNRTNLNEVFIETRPARQAELIKRPRAHQYQSLTQTATHSSLLSEPKDAREMTESSASSFRNSEERSSDNLRKQLSRLDLFVDLVWVGIIANISSTFSKIAFSGELDAIGIAVLEFILLFLPIWRLWDSLRVYCVNYYTDDVIQRNFMIWILILSVLYGINAPYAFSNNNTDDANSLTLLIGIYLVARASFLIAQLVQSIFLPFLWRLFFFKLLVCCIASAFWIAAIYVDYPGKLGLLVVGNVIEHPVAIWLLSPTADRLLTPGMKRIVHIDHYVERYEEFFIIILGEGVVRLIEGSPSGMAITARSGTVLTAFLMYYILHWLYFNGDRTKVFVHALRRTWWKPVLWQTFHLYLFAAQLILASSSLYMIEHLPGHGPIKGEQKREVASAREEAPDDSPTETLYAMWSASVALAIVLFSMTVIALLNRPVDKEGTLVVNSRWVRLGLRIPVTVVILCLPVMNGMIPSIWFGSVVPLLYALFLYEWLTGLEKGWRLIEPRENAE